MARIVVWLLLGAMLASPFMAVAQDGLPEKTLKRLRNAPDAYLAEAAQMILGFGGPKGLDAAGVERFIAAERAFARGRELGRMLAADLDNDGTVSGAEVAALGPALSARSRADLALALRAADGNGDGAADAAELRTFAQVEGLAHLPEDDAAILRAFPAFDKDGDGFVTLAEVAETARAVAGDAGG